MICSGACHDESVLSKGYFKSSRGKTTIVEDVTRYIWWYSGCECDADGSPRAKEIDPKWGQLETSLGKHNGWKGEGEYVNSETIPYFVLPLDFEAVTGCRVQLGDLAILKWEGHSVAAILADRGPKGQIGEASICAIEALGGDPWDSDHNTIVRGADGELHFELYPCSADLDQCVDFSSIQKYLWTITGRVMNPAQGK